MAALPTRLRPAALALALAIAAWQARFITVARAQAAVPRRIVSLVPATTEMLFAMGAGDRVIGVSSYDRYPPAVESRTRLGGLLDPDVERLLALHPDLVIVYGTQTDLRQQLARAGIETFSYVDQGLPEIMGTIRTLGARVGSRAAADALAADMERRLDAIRARVAGHPRPRALLVIGRQNGSLQQIIASGGSGFLHDMLLAAGADDVLGDVHRKSVQMSTEMVLARRPDVILELHYGASLDATALERERRVWNALPAVPAVRDGRVYPLVGDEFVVPGPRVVSAVERFARVLHPEVFR
jgi:cobalamin transport system substrate-binding protein